MKRTGTTMRRRAAAALGAILGACLLAACASSEGGGASAATVKIGLIGDFSGVMASSFGGIPSVVNAWAAAANASGGLNGEKVAVVTEDTGTDANGVTIAKELVSDGVAAVIEWPAGGASSNDGTWLPYFESRDIPVIVTEPPSTAASLKDPLVFPVSAPGPVEVYAFTATAQKLGSRLGVAYCSDAPSCGGVASEFRATASSLGVTVAATVSASSAAPDYTSVCEAFKENKVNSYYLNFAAAAAGRITDTCAQDGVKVPQLLTAGTASPDWSSDPAFAGSQVIDNSVPYFDTKIPAVAAYRAALTKYAPGVAGTALDNAADLWNWAAGELIEAAADKSGGQVTSPSLLKGLYSIKDQTLDGLVQPLNYTKGKPTWLACWFNWTISSANSFAAVNDSNRSCAPQPEVNRLVNALLESG